MISVRAITEEITGQGLPAGPLFGEVVERGPLSWGTIGTTGGFST